MAKGTATSTRARRSVRRTTRAVSERLVVTTVARRATTELARRLRSCPCPSVAVIAAASAALLQHDATSVATRAAVHPRGPYGSPVASTKRNTTTAIVASNDHLARLKHAFVAGS